MNRATLLFAAAALLGLAADIVSKEIAFGLLPKTEVFVLADRGRVRGTVVAEDAESFDVLTSSGVEKVRKSRVRGWCPPEEAWLVRGWVGFRRSRNTGALFGAFAGMGVLFVLISLGATAVMIWVVVVRKPAPGRYVSITLGLLAGGILGNLYDRLFHGFVRDFIGLHAGSFTWPYFNVADVLIVAGIGLMVLRNLAAGRGGADAGDGDDGDGED